MRDMRILITGGAGFIGSHTADALIDRGHQVRMLNSRAEFVEAESLILEDLPADHHVDRLSRTRAVRGRHSTWVAGEVVRYREHKLVQTVR